MTHNEINALIFLVFLIAAGVCAIPGWLTGLPDGVERFGWRFTSWTLLFIAWVAEGATHRLWSGQWWFSFLFMFYAINRATHWWRELEKARELRRRIQAYNRGEIYRGKR